MSELYRPDPNLDLVLERVIETPPHLVWACWTQPQHMLHWFVPPPWKLADAEIDLQPGGMFKRVMRSPEGEMFANVGCVLEVQTNARFVWTDALLPGFRPAEEPFFTGVIQIEAVEGGTRYLAMARHSVEESREQHAAMGFAEGWGMALDQLVAYAATL